LIVPPRDWLLVWTTALAWYHVGFVWLVQVVAWPLFAYVGASEFDAYHKAWWRGIRYILFVPSGLALVGGLLLLFFAPAGVPEWLRALGLGLYVLTYVVTAIWFGPQQAQLTDTRSPRFALIIKTHWVRTALVSGSALCYLAAVALRIGHA
jgi:hypothetical protein